MQSEVGYLFSELWRGKEEGEESKEGDKEKRRDRMRGKEVGRGRSCFSERETGKEESQAASRKKDLPTSAERVGKEGVGMACLLKRQDKSVQEKYFNDYMSKMRWIDFSLQGCGTVIGYLKPLICVHPLTLLECIHLKHLFLKK